MVSSERRSSSADSLPALPGQTPIDTLAQRLPNPFRQSDTLSLFVVDIIVRWGSAQISLTRMLYFSTMDALTASLTEVSGRKGLPREFAERFAEAFAAEFATVEVQPTRPGTLGMLVGRYALRKDDLKLFDAITDGLKSAASVSFFASNQPAVGAKVAIGVSLARLLRTLVMRGVWLDPDTLQILTILRCNVSTPADPGLSAEELLSVVQRTKPEADLGRVQRLLSQLNESPTRDGTTARLAFSDPAGRWRPQC